MSRTTDPPARYRVLVAIDYPAPEDVRHAAAGALERVRSWHHAEPGDVVDDIPERSAAWLLADGIIELAEGGE
jgi:hypothetical protein